MNHVQDCGGHTRLTAGRRGRAAGPRGGRGLSPPSLSAWEMGLPALGVTSFGWQGGWRGAAQGAGPRAAAGRRAARTTTHINHTLQRTRRQNARGIPTTSLKYAYASRQTRRSPTAACSSRSPLPPLSVSPHGPPPPLRRRGTPSAASKRARDPPGGRRSS